MKIVIQNQKKVLKKIGKKDEQNSKSIVNMIMEYGYNSKRSQVIAIDTETLVSQTQDRMWKALKRRYQYDSTVKPGQDFLLNSWLLYECICKNNFTN
jgi:N-acetyl-anhydromuramyl-L-alanine amidase AmpD